MSFKVEYFTLGSGDATNRYVPLAGVPLSRVALDVISGTSQFDQTTFVDSSSNWLSPDFYFVGTTVRWDTTAYALYWDGTVGHPGLNPGDKIRVIYDRS